MASFLNGGMAQFFKTGTGEFLAGGKVYSYIAGTSTPKATYPSMDDASALTNANTNPVILNERGEAPVILAGPTKIVLKDENDNTVWTLDDLDTSTQTIFDENGNELLTFSTATNAVNNLNITNAATGNAPILSSVGGDTNIGMKFTPKGTGQVSVTANGFSVTGPITGSTTVTAATGFTATTGNITATTGNLVGSATGAQLVLGGAQAYIGRTTTTPGYLYCYEASNNGTDFIVIGAPVSLAATYQMEWPATIPATGNVIYASASGILNHQHPRNFVTSVKFWVRFTSVTTTSITDSYNVTSLTDNGTGNTTINLTTAFANATYAVTGTVSSGGGPVVLVHDGTTLTSSACRVASLNTSFAAVDAITCVVGAGN